MIVILMGVAGCGKTTVGQRLACTHRCGFLDGDDFHPPANVEKIRSGGSLTDLDRRPWLQRLHQVLIQHVRSGDRVVLACSALKSDYRDTLEAGIEEATWFVHLVVDRQTVQQRIADRKDHFAGASIIDSQFATLQRPRGERVIDVDATDPPDRLVKRITRYLPG